MLDKLLGLIAPFECLGCGAEGQLLCEGCTQDAFGLVPSRCYRCYAATRDSAVCRSCRGRTRLRHVWVATEYGVLAKELLWRFKFSRARAAHEVLARALDDTLPFLPPNTILTHVPTATGRVRLRGYDHAELVAKALARRRNLTHHTLLARLGQSRQVGARREQRLAQLEGAFRPLRHSVIDKAHIVLIDDVLTTGATIDTAAKVLKQAGARQVTAALFAQKL